jgi:hypothetical protein
LGKTVGGLGVALFICLGAAMPTLRVAEIAGRVGFGR